MTVLHDIIKRNYGLAPRYAPTPDAPYIVRVATAQMPSSCKGLYGKVAVIETDGTGEPTMIRDGAKHVRRIVWVQDALNVGRTTRSAFGSAVARAVADCEQLNT